jgi:uncharacterized protein (DUF2267 family)
MSTGLDVIDATVQQTNLWLKELMKRLGTEDRHLAYKVLSATLHAVRDRIGPQNAAHLGAQLPMLIRGLYYEGWHPGSPPKLRHKQDFLDYVNGDQFRGLGIEPEPAVRAVLGVMSCRLDVGEVEKLKSLFPEELRALWPIGPIAGN